MLHPPKSNFFSGEALALVLKKLERDLDRPANVLDVGCGDGKHTVYFTTAGHITSALDINPDGLRTAEERCLKEKPDCKFNPVLGFFHELESMQKFDCVWASHVLEHQPNVGDFLRKCFNLLEDGGIFAVTVPPGKKEIVGGHLTNWNTGILLYNLILAGFDCSEAAVATYGYNVSVVVRKKERPGIILKYDNGDITTLSPYFPWPVKENFNGEILGKTNWE